MLSGNVVVFSGVSRPFSMVEIMGVPPSLANGLLCNRDSFCFGFSMFGAVIFAMVSLLGTSAGNEKANFVSKLVPFAGLSGSVASSVLLLIDSELWLVGEYTRLCLAYLHSGNFGLGGEGLWGSHAHGHMPMIQSLALSQASLPDLTRRRRNSCPRALFYLGNKGYTGRRS